MSSNRQKEKKKGRQAGRKKDRGSKTDIRPSRKWAGLSSLGRKEEGPLDEGEDGGKENSKETDKSLSDISA